MLNKTPKINSLKPTLLMGQKVLMSFSEDRTLELWENFAPKLKSLPQKSNGFLYSVQVYPDLDFFKTFDPTREFEKWAAIEYRESTEIPADMHNLNLPEGLYAVFHYKGRPSEAQAAFRYIFGEWLPGSEYDLDDRPHFALMGAKYKGEDPESEEEFWIPIKAKE